MKTLCMTFVWFVFGYGLATLLIDVCCKRQ
jgi:hypothetical protein